MAEGGHSRGRAVSWLAVVIILAGFTLGGFALVLGLWWLFWVAFGIVVVGGIIAVAVDIFADVQLDPLHQGGADAHVSPVRGEIAGDSEQPGPAGYAEPTDPAHRADVVEGAKATVDRTETTETAEATPAQSSEA